MEEKERKEKYKLKNIYFIHLLSLPKRENKRKLIIYGAFRESFKFWHEMVAFHWSKMEIM